MGHSPSSSELVSSVLIILLTVVLAYVVPRALSIALHRAPSNLRHATVRLSAVLIGGTGILGSLEVLRWVQIPTLLVALWSVGLPIFLGTLLSPLASGFLMLLSPPFRIGERVRIQTAWTEVAGVVVDLDTHFTHIYVEPLVQLVPNQVLPSAIITRPVHDEDIHVAS